MCFPLIYSEITNSVFEKNCEYQDIKQATKHYRIIPTLLFQTVLTLYTILLLDTGGILFILILHTGGILFPFHFFFFQLSFYYFYSLYSFFGNFYPQCSGYYIASSFEVRGHELNIPCIFHRGE